MGGYSVKTEKIAKKHLAAIFKSGNKAYIKKIEQIFVELAINPTIGIGKPEQLKHQLVGFWSRRINLKDRLIYRIEDTSVIVVSAQGNYFGI